MTDVSRIIARLRAENTVLRALVVRLGGMPPPHPPADAAAVRSVPVLTPTLSQLARRGL